MQPVKFFSELNTTLLMKLDLQAQYGFAALPLMAQAPGEGGVVAGVVPGEGGVLESSVKTLQRLSSKIGAGEGGVPTNAALVR